MNKNLKPNKFNIMFSYTTKQYLKTFLLITIIFCAYILLIVAVFPIVKDALAEMMNDPQFAEIMESMGGLINLSDIKDYFTAEAGELWGLFGSIFVCFMAVSMVQKDIKQNSAEFLYSQPINKLTIIKSKFLSLLMYTSILNLSLAVVSYLSIIIFAGINSVSFINFLIFAICYTILHTILALIVWSVSIYTKKRGGMIFGIIIPIILYVLFTISQITTELNFLKYFTPFSILNSNILTNGLVNFEYVIFIIWSAISVALIILSFFKFKNDDVI